MGSPPTHTRAADVDGGPGCCRPLTLWLRLGSLELCSGGDAPTSGTTALRLKYPSRPPRTPWDMETCPSHATPRRSPSWSLTIRRS